MEAFHIHEDIVDELNSKTVVVKENKLRNNVALKMVGGGKDKRQTLAVLNVNHTHVQVATNIRRDANVLGVTHKKLADNRHKITDENDVPFSQGIQYAQGAVGVANKKANNRVSVPVDQFKAFCVDENAIIDENQRPPNDDCEQQSDERDTPNACMTEMRQPLQEIKSNELLQTPISIDNSTISPMSIDKSMGKCDISLSRKTDRDRFFDNEEYQLNFIEYLRESETKHLPKYGYMRKQPDINHTMRTILIDWLVEVCEEYRLHNETLGLAVSYIDRFLSKMSVVRAKLQLVGTAAMFIASKYEEIYPPDVGEFVYITDKTYSKQQVLRMEQFILKALTFDLCVPTAYTFIMGYGTIAQIPDKIKFLAMYIAELSLLESEPYLQYVPSKISAAAISLALYNCDQPIWNKKIEEIMGYKLDDIKEVIMHLNQTHIAAVSLQQQAIQEKYKSNKYLEVSKLFPATLGEEEFNAAAVRVQEYEKVAESNVETNENSFEDFPTPYFREPVITKNQQPGSEAIKSK